MVMRIPFKNIAPLIYSLVLIMLAACSTTNSSRKASTRIDHPLLNAKIDEEQFFSPSEQSFDPQSYQQANFNRQAFQMAITYPLAALQDKAQGKMLMKLYITEQGTIAKAEILKSVHPSIDRNVLDNLRSIQIPPATMDGQPIASQLLVPLSFNFSIKKMNTHRH
jgi:TonB family protein